MLGPAIAVFVLSSRIGKGAKAVSAAGGPKPSLWTFRLVVGGAVLALLAALGLAWNVGAGSKTSNVYHVTLLVVAALAVVRLVRLLLRSFDL